MQSRQEAIDYIRMQRPDPFLERAKKSGYVCPCCASGSGPKGTGMNKVPGTPLYKCFSCGLVGDVFKLIGEKYGLTSFNDKLEAACDIYHVGYERRRRNDQVARTISQVGTQSVNYTARTRPETKRPEIVIPDQRPYYETCETRRRESQECLEYLHGRGLTDETLDRFHVGFDPSWRHPKHPDRPENYTPRVIIPLYNPEKHNSYLARALAGHVPKTQYDRPKMKVGSQNLYNPEAIQPGKVVFVVEGEIDCMSIEQLGFPCIALGSISMYERLVNLTKDNPERVDSTFFVIALDSDERGQEFGKKLSDLLTQQGTLAMLSTKLSGECKDPNDRLVKDPEGLKRTLKALTKIGYQALSKDIAFRVTKLMFRADPEYQRLEASFKEALAKVRKQLSLGSVEDIKSSLDALDLSALGEKTHESAEKIYGELDLMAKNEDWLLANRMQKKKNTTLTR